MAPSSYLGLLSDLLPKPASLTNDGGVCIGDATQMSVNESQSISPKTALALKQICH
jgi:hypothetical protein